MFGIHTHFKIAVLQARSKSGALQQNTQTILAKMQEASRQGADVLLLPECFLTGYDVLPICNQDALCENHFYLEQICTAAKEWHIGVVATAFTKGITKPRNSAYVIDKNGTILMKYDKVHTCDFAEESCLENGTEFKVCNFHGVCLGVMICYDREYPESARVLMLKGAEIILVPNDCTSMQPRVQALSTRAYENMVAVAMANPCGKEAGHSCAFSPICWDKEGHCINNTLFLAGEEDECIFFADIEMSTLRSYRKSEMMGNTFRKTQTYADLVTTKVQEPFIRNRFHE